MAGSMLKTFDKLKCIPRGSSLISLDNDGGQENSLVLKQWINSNIDQIGIYDSRTFDRHIPIYVDSKPL